MFLFINNFYLAKNLLLKQKPNKQAKKMRLGSSDFLTPYDKKYKRITISKSSKSLEKSPRYMQLVYTKKKYQLSSHYNNFL